jgi:phenylacetate-CoA ligase
MPETAQRIYHRLPAPLRSVAASLRGLYLQRWRAGPGFDQEFAVALERDTWSPARLRHWQEERVAEMLDRAARSVPYYRAQWTARRRRGDRSAKDVLANWPILDKDAVREQPLAFVADDRDPRQLFREYTSGTTGKSVEVRRSRATLTRLYAIAQARTLAWHGIPRGVHWARLGGQLVVPTHRTRPPFWVWNHPMRQLYLSTFHLAPQFLPHQLDALVRFGVRYISSYPSSITTLAHAMLRSGRDDIRLDAVFTNAEGVTDAQRAAIQQAFHGPVRETYGQAEMVTAASECPAGRLHLWPEAGLLEVIPGDGSPADASAWDGTATGEFICTGLLNVDMPLIRYRIGDRGRRSTETHCACGRTLPQLDAVEGRTNDVLRTRDGRSIFWLNPIFYGLDVQESQIEQGSLEQVTVRVVPGVGFAESRDGATIASRLRERLGSIDVALTLVSQIPRTRNGNLRSVICNVPPEAIAGPVPGAATTAG